MHGWVLSLTLFLSLLSANAQILGQYYLQNHPAKFVEGYNYRYVPTLANQNGKDEAPEPVDASQRAEYQLPKYKQKSYHSSMKAVQPPREKPAPAPPGTICFNLAVPGCDAGVTDCCGAGSYDLQLNFDQSCGNFISRLSYDNVTVHSSPTTPPSSKQASFLVDSLTVKPLGTKFCMHFKSPCQNIQRVCRSFDSCSYQLIDITSGATCSVVSWLRERPGTTKPMVYRSTGTTANKVEAPAAETCDADGFCAAS